MITILDNIKKKNLSAKSTKRFFMNYRYILGFIDV